MDELERPAVIETILSRRSIRRFTTQEVEHQKLIWVLEVAMAAPNACNSQPWEFIVVTDANVLGLLRSKLLFARYHASAVMENMLIAAAGMSLGAVWIGVLLKNDF